MSYTYELADEAMVGFRQLETWLAEESWTKWSRSLPFRRLRGRRTASGVVREIVRDRGADRFYVFFTVIVDEPHQILRVSSLGHYVRRGHQPVDGV